MLVASAGLGVPLLSGCGCRPPPAVSAPSANRPSQPEAGDSSGPLDIEIPDEGVSIHIGPRETLVEPGRLKLDYGPDMATVVIERSPLRALITAGTRTMLVAGDDWNHLSSSKEVLSPGGPGEFDNGYVGVTGVYRHSDGTLYAIYYAEDHEGMPRLPLGGGIPGFYASQGLASSTDNGDTWTKLGRVITSSKPKEWTHPSCKEQADRGAGESGTVLTPDGKWLYVYYTEHSRVGGRGVQVCLARSRVGDEPPSLTSFFKYHDGQFGEPGLGGQDTPVLSAFADDESDAMYPHVVYMPALQKYVMILSINHWKEYVLKRGLNNSGIHVALSDDGIRWSAPTRLLVDWAVPLEGRSLSWEATLVLDREGGLEGWLLYGYSPRWGHTQTGNIPHHLVGRRVIFRELPLK